MRREKEPQLHKAKPVPKAERDLKKRPLSVADPLEIPDAPEPQSEGSGPPSVEPPALEALPVGGFHPFGETEFAWIYRNLVGLQADVDLLSGVSGPIAGTETQNVFITNQTIEMTDLTSTVIPLLIDINNNAPGVSYPLRLAHRYAPSVGPVGLGVGISLEVESGTEGVKNSIAAFEAQSTVNTAGAMTGEAGVNVVVAGNPERVMTWGHQNIRNHFQPAATATHALFNLGTGGTFTGNAAGTYVGVKAASGWSGDYMAFWRDGQATADFRIDNDGDVYVRGTLLGGGGGDAFIGISNAWSAAQTFTLNDTSPAATVYPLAVRHTHSAGAGQNNIGVGMNFEVENASSSAVNAGRIAVAATDAGAATLKSTMRFSVWENAIERQYLSLTHNALYFQAPVPATVNHGALNLGQGAFGGGAGNFVGNAAGTLIAGNQDPGFNGDWLNFQEDGNVRTVISGDGELRQTVWDGTTTGPTTALRVQHRIDTAGTPASGMGVSIDLWADDAGKTARLYGKIGCEATNPAVAAVDSALVFYSSRGGSQTEVLRFTPTGRMNIVDEIYQNAVKRRLHRSATMVLMQAFTPGSTGADTAELLVPPDPEDGSTSITWNVRRLDLRVGTAGGAPSMKVQKSTASGAFGAGTDVGTVTLGSGDNEGSTTSGLGTVTSGNKLRVNVLALGTAQNWTVQVLLESQ